MEQVAILDPIIIPAGYYKIVLYQLTGPASYTTGGFTIRLSEVNNIFWANAGSTGGYLFTVKNFSGNSVTIQVFQQGTAAGALAEVAGGTNLSSVTFYLHVVGI